MVSSLYDPRRSTGCTRSAFRALNRTVTPAVKAGIGGPLPVGNGLVVLETTGRKSGKPRQVPLLANRLGNTIWISTVRRGSQWVRNLRADPEVSVWVGGKKRTATATVTSSAPLTVVSLRVH
ncbi:MAG: nitroreductase/quinone reductase family protein [Actinomycetota bacterium]